MEEGKELMQREEKLPAKLGPQGVGAAIGSIIIVIVLIAGAIFFLDKVLKSSEPLDQAIVANQDERVSETEQKN